MRLPNTNGSWRDSNREPCDPKTSFLPLFCYFQECISYLCDKLKGFMQMEAIICSDEDSLATLTLLRKGSINLSMND